MDHTSRHRHSSRQLSLLAYLFILCPYSNVRITHPSSSGVLPNLKLAGPKCRIVHPFLWRIFELSDAVLRYVTYQLLSRLLLIHTSQNAYMLCLLLLSNKPIRHVYVCYFNHHMLQSTPQVPLENPVWYIQQRFRAELPFQASFSSFDRWYVILLGLADLPYLLPSAQFSVTVLTFYRDDASMMTDLYHIPIIILLCSSFSSPSLKWRRITPYINWSLGSPITNSSAIPLTCSGGNPCHWRIEISLALSYSWNVLLVSLSLVSRCFLLITCQELRPYWSNPVVVRCLGQSVWWTMMHVSQTQP